MSYFSNMKSVFYLFLLFLILSCLHKEKTFQSFSSKSPYANITLYDDFNNQLVPDTIYYNRIAQFSPLYVGDLKDSIKLIYKAPKIKHRTTNWLQYKLPRETDLDIYIDTTKTIGFSMPSWKNYIYPEQRGNTKSYPVFIKNISSDTLNVAIGNMLTIITETQDSINKWKPIEKRFLPSCGSSIVMLYLAPQQILITPLRQNVGTQKKKLRLKFEIGPKKKIYSNEIESFCF